MASFSDLADAVSTLFEKGGPYLVALVVLIWLVWDINKRLDRRDEAHASERNKQSALHRAHISTMMASHRLQTERMMKSHTAERAEWKATLKEASQEFKDASVNQGDRLATAIITALQRPHP